MLEFEPKSRLKTPVEVFQITPQRLRQMTLNQVRGLPVFVGNLEIPLQDVFSVSGDPADLHHVWRGDLSRVGGLGYQMSAGRIQIHGDAGNHVGSRLSGGTIQVSGRVGDYAGSEMTGGLIHVRGDAGNLVGAAYDGGQAGQNGGAILVEGSAGHAVGKAMRRGLIAIGGDTGHCCGFLMRAGTIVVFGQAGKQVGTEMTRGTILLPGPPPSAPGDFARGGRQAMPVAGLLNRYLTKLGFSKTIEVRQFQLFHGDPLRGSRGAVWMASPNDLST